MGNILRIENLKHENIMPKVSFSLDENTLNVLVGPNGCGKTTLIDCIIGMKEYKGKIFIDNEELKLSNRKKIITKIGYFSSKNKLIKKVVIDNLEYPLLNLEFSASDSRKKTYEIAKIMDIENLLFKNIEDLTVSEANVIKFIVSVISCPKLILIDDTLDDISYFYKKKIIKYLKKISKISCVLIASSFSELLIISDNIIFMDDDFVLKGKTKKYLWDEKQFNKANVKLPFVYDLSNKLKSYDLISENYDNIDDLIGEIWQ